MKRKGLHKPTIEDAIELSGIETLHPGGFALTRRTAELAGLQPGMSILDVSSGRGTQAIFYAREFGVAVTGLDIAEDMIQTASRKAKQAGLDGQVRFRQGDSQNLPFESDQFDVVINECAVGIPDDSQRVLDEMARVTTPGGVVAMHESTWKQPLSHEEKEEFSERYGTTPLAVDEWVAMLSAAGVTAIETECDPWSNPEMFWKIRQERDVQRPSQVLTLPERMTTAAKVFHRYGLKGVLKVFQNERIFYRAILEGKLGYCLFKGVAP
ncbi:MAG: class I SAM-dependent methyltransferase [Desulfobacterales bacterium]|jgi:ubiquinone/menaquinone biosynthesis C-methylase UbiE